MTIRWRTDAAIALRLTHSWHHWNHAALLGQVVRIEHALRVRRTGIYMRMMGSCSVNSGRGTIIVLSLGCPHTGMYPRLLMLRFHPVAALLVVIVRVLRGWSN